MLSKGDQYIAFGTLLTVKSARIDDHYVYVVWENLGYMKIGIKNFLKKFISATSLVNINFFKEECKNREDKHNFQLSI